MVITVYQNFIYFQWDSSLLPFSPDDLISVSKLSEVRMNLKVNVGILEPICLEDGRRKWWIMIIVVSEVSELWFRFTESNSRFVLMSMSLRKTPAGDELALGVWRIPVPGHVNISLRVCINQVMVLLCVDYICAFASLYTLLLLSLLFQTLFLDTHYLQV